MDRTTPGKCVNASREPGTRARLPPPEAKLFFVLFYFKCYPAPGSDGRALWRQPGAGQSLGGRAHALGQRGFGTRVAPSRPTPRRSGNPARRTPELRLLVIDGAERPVRRPKTRMTRSKTTAARRKPIARRTCSFPAKSGCVYLGPTSPGSVHDKKARRRKRPDLSARCARAQGHRLPGLRTTGHRLPSSPRKSHGDANSIPSKRPSTRSSAGVRVTVEHAIAGVKSDAASSPTRCGAGDAGLVDEAMLSTASGLHEPA